MEQVCEHRVATLTAPLKFRRDMVCDECGEILHTEILPQPRRRGVYSPHRGVDSSLHSIR